MDACSQVKRLERTLRLGQATAVLQEERPKSRRTHKGLELASLFAVSILIWLLRGMLTVT